jgi:hypothetical protein
MSWKLFKIDVTVFTKFLEPPRCLSLKVGCDVRDSDIRDSFLGLNHEHRDGAVCTNFSE